MGKGRGRSQQGLKAPAPTGTLIQHWKALWILLLAALALTTSLCLTARVLRPSWVPVLQQT